MKNLSRLVVAAAWAVWLSLCLNTAAWADSLTAPGTMQIAISNTSSLVVSASGTGAGLTFTFEVGGNGPGWTQVPAVSLASGAATVVSGGTSNGMYVINTVGMSRVRVNLTAISSGTETFDLNVGGSGSVVYLPTSISVSASITNPSTGGAVPATANYIAGSQGGTLTGVTMTSGAVNVHCDGTCAGSGNPNGQATMANSAPVVISSNQSAVPVTAAQSTASNLNATVVGTGTFAVQATENLTQVGGANVSLGQKTQANSIPVAIPSDYGTAQGATTSGLLGSMVMCAATTAAPTPLNGTTNALNCNPANGAVRVDPSSVTSPISASTLPLPTGAATATNQTNVTQTVAAGTAAANSNLVGCVAATSVPSPTNGQGIATQCDLKGNARDVIMDAAGNSRGVNVTAGNALTVDGSASIQPASQSGTWTFQPGNTANTTPWLVQSVPGTTGGWTGFVLEPAASDNHAVIKNGAGTVGGMHYFNKSATINYVRLYNAGSGFNGCNSATNLAWEGHIPANSTNDAGAILPMPDGGLAFSTGISICVTGAYGQTDTTNATASSISLDVLWK